MKWISALKKYNESKPMWCIPRRGTIEHKKVLEIMKGNKTTSTSNVNTGTKGQQTFNKALSNIERKALMKKRLNRIKKLIRQE